MEEEKSLRPKHSDLFLGIPRSRTQPREARAGISEFFNRKERQKRSDAETA